MEVEHVDMVSSGCSDSSAQVLRNSRPEFRPPAALTRGFITGTLIVTNNLSLQSPDGGAAMGGIAAHGYVNGKAVSRPPGMSEANLPWPHLRSGALK